MEQMLMPKTWQQNMAYSSNHCTKHKYCFNGEEKTKLVQMMVIGGVEVCPRCETERETEKLKIAESARFKEMNEKKQYNIFLKQSIIADATLLNASFDTYKADTPEEINNKNTCLDITERLKDGQVFNCLLQGGAGVGKSHLSFSILQKLNESYLNTSSLFISVDEMIRLIKDSFSNKDSKYTEQYFVKLLSSVSVLCLDDLGSETGSITSEKTATDFVQRILYAVTSSRQDKVTITTTNLSSKHLFNMYDKKLVSRLLRNTKYVLFKETKDKRMTNVPF